MLAILSYIALGSQAMPLVLRHDDGASAGPNDYSALKGQKVEIKELVRFDAPRRMSVTAVHAVFGGVPGKAEIHVWKDIDSSIKPYIPFRHFEFDVVPPLTLTLAKKDLRPWKSFSLATPFELQKGERVFVGTFASNGPKFACDQRLDHEEKSVVELFYPGNVGAAQTKLLSPAGDFMVRLVGKPLQEDRSVRFQPFFRKQGAVTGLSWGDADGDGFEDLLVNGKTLLKNLRGRGFLDVSKASRLEETHADFGLLADFNGDGNLDMFQGTAGRTYPDSLRRNAGKGVFAPWPKFFPEERLYGRSACIIDLEPNGKPEIVVANGAKLGDLTNAGPSHIYLNSGRWFEALPGRIGQPLPGSKTPPFGSSLIAGDLNDDGRADLFMGTYRLEPDQLWQSGMRSIPGVRTSPSPSGKLSGGHALGCAMVDFDYDGDLDLVVANLMHPDWRGYLGSVESLLWENLGQFKFKRRTLRSLGMAFEETPANPIFEDFDNDGRLDLFHHSMYHSANLYLWRNGKWVERTSASGIDVSQATTAAACDFDRDGRVDLALANQNKELVIYRNVSPHKNWIQLRLIGNFAKRDAVGAIARIKLGGKTLTRSVTIGRGMACQDSIWLHFGLGSFKGPVSGEVTWPRGHKEKFGPIPINRRQVARER